MISKTYEEMHHRTHTHGHISWTKFIFFLLGRGNSKINEAISRVRGTFQFANRFIYINYSFGIY